MSPVAGRAAGREGQGMGMLGLAVLVGVITSVVALWNAHVNTERIRRLERLTGHALPEEGVSGQPPERKA